jgi:transcriptional regulator with XRE-family HTH domain
MTDLGSRIEQRRRQLGWKQSFLASKAGIHQSAISRIERGQRANIGLETLERLATALNLSTASLLSDQILEQGALEMRSE